MMDENVCSPNGRPATAAPALVEADALLLYQAKQNVKDKKNLVRHIVAYVAALPVLAIFYGIGSVSDGVHYPRPQFSVLWDLFPYVPEQYHGILGNAINELEWTYHHSYNYAIDLWLVAFGMMVAWGGWIAVRIAKRVLRNMSEKSTRNEKPDPVIQEYQRLKRMAENEMM